MSDSTEENAARKTERNVAEKTDRIPSRTESGSGNADLEKTALADALSVPSREDGAESDFEKTDRTVVMSASGRMQDGHAERWAKNPESGGDAAVQAQTRFFQFFASDSSAKRDVVDEIEFGSRRIELPRLSLSGNSGKNLPDVSERFRPLRLLFRTHRDIVDLGRDRALERVLAIHSLRSEHLLNKQMRKAFVKEAELTAQLDHPAIVPVYNLNGDYRGGLHMTVKLINGMDFHSYIEEICVRYRLHGIQHYDESKSLIRRLGIFLRACDAIEYAHSRGVVHGNLNPESVVIGEFHAAYVRNWGQARFSGRAIPYDGSDPACLAPEILQSEPCDERADVYSLGQLLYQAVTLRPAFSSDNPGLVRAAILAGRTPPVEHRFHFRVDADLRAIIQKATQRRPENRYRSVLELSTDVRRYLNDERLSFQRSTFSGSFFRLLRHNRQKVIFLAFLAVFSTLFFFCYDLYREARHVHEGAVRDAVLDRCFSLCMQSGHMIDLQAAKFNSTLQNLAAEAEAVLTHPPQFSDSGVLRSRTNASGQSPQAEGALPAQSDSLANIEFNRDFAMGTPVLADEDFQKFSVLLHPLYRALLGCEFGVVVTPENVESLGRRALEGSLPIHEIQIAFDSGEFMRYPFRSEASPASSAQFADDSLGDSFSSPKPAWSKPYSDDSGERRMSLTLPFGIGGRSLGTISLVFSCRTFESMARNAARKAPGLLSKSILNEKGDILLNFRFGDDVVVECNAGRATNPELLKAVQERTSGTLILNEDGKEILHCFARIPSCSFIYLERCDLGEALRASLKEADRL